MSSMGVAQQPAMSTMATTAVPRATAARSRLWAAAPQQPSRPVAPVSQSRLSGAPQQSRSTAPPKAPAPSPVKLQAAPEPAPGQQPAVEAPPPPVAAPPVAAIPPEMLREGIPFVEAAFRNGTAAAALAQSVRSGFPRVLIEQLVAAGEDGLLAAIEAVAPDSILVTLGGRRYIRERP